MGATVCGGLGRENSARSCDVRGQARSCGEAQPDPPVRAALAAKAAHGARAQNGLAAAGQARHNRRHEIRRNHQGNRAGRQGRARPGHGRCGGALRRHPGRRGARARARRDPHRLPHQERGAARVARLQAGDGLAHRASHRARRPALRGAADLQRRAPSGQPDAAGGAAAGARGRAGADPGAARFRDPGESLRAARRARPAAGRGCGAGFGAACAAAPRLHRRGQAAARARPAARATHPHGRARQRPHHGQAHRPLPRTQRARSGGDASRVPRAHG